jgi:hypothetical protein
LDVNGDGSCSLQDLLDIVQYIRSHPPGRLSGEGEGEAPQVGVWQPSSTTDASDDASEVQNDGRGRISVPDSSSRFLVAARAGDESIEIAEPGSFSDLDEIVDAIAEDVAGRVCRN